MKHFEGLAEMLVNKSTKTGTLTVRDSVKLHHETVTNAEEIAKRVKRKRRVVRKPKVEIQTVKVDPEVMAKALELAGGDHTRLTIEKEGAVIVWNHPRTTKPQENR